ncbi:MAG: TMEM165/GDT1 family protein [Burkholderiales bacterium]
MDAFLASTLLVAMAEIGDKTQLLSFALAARLRRPGAIIAGILFATLANHALAGSLGVWLASLLSPQAQRYGTAFAFFAFALWALKPDSLDAAPDSGARGAFVTTLVAFFLVEMGDKTQLATIALAARYEALAPVVLGTTLGMMIANVPAVLVGERLAARLNLRAMRYTAAALFAATGVVALVRPA